MLHLAGNFNKEPLTSDWYPLSMYVSTDDLLKDMDETIPGKAYENRNDLFFSSYRWSELPSGFSTQANSLVGTVLASNLVVLGNRSQPWNIELRMFSLTQETWTQIGKLPGNL